MPWILAATAHHIARAARVSEPQRTGLRRRLGLASSAPHPLAIVAADKVFAVLEAQERAGDRWLNVRAATEGFDQQISSLWYYVRVLPTLGAATEAMARYNLLTTDCYAWDLTRERGVTSMSTPDPGRPGFRRFVEFEVVDRVRAARALVSDFRLSALALPGPAPDDDGPLRAHVGVAPDWGAPAVRLSFESTFMRRSLGRPDALLEAHLRRPLDDRLALLTARRPLGDRAGDLLRSLLQTGHGLPDRATMADHLGLTERTFNRRLAAEGTTWRAVRDGVRAALAREWLADHAVADVARRLGFSDGRSLARAFRRWCGTSPARWAAACRRRRLHSEEAGIYESETSAGGDPLDGA